MVNEVKLAVEIYAHKPLAINPDTYFQIALWSDGKIIPDSLGVDVYRLAAIITSDKRLSGIGRRFDYSLNSFPAGMGPIEACPAQYIPLTYITDDLSLSIHTNLGSNTNELADNLGIRLLNEYGKQFNIPSYQTGLSMSRDEDNYYHIPLSSFLQRKSFQEVSQES